MPLKKRTKTSQTPTTSPKASKKLKTDAPAASVGPVKVVEKTSKPKKPVHPKAPMTFRHNVLPPLLGVLMFLSVLGLLNAQWIVAQYQYRFMKPIPTSSFSAAPATTDPNAPAKLYIPEINVNAPLVTNEKSYNAANVQLALRRGPVQYGASVDPGQKGNIVIVGHSSGQLWAPGNYKFVFTLLDKLGKNDRILIDFKGTRYIYRVDDSKVVKPTDISVLAPTDKPQLTLITCTPVGTSKNRLVITARQVSPKPETAVAPTRSQPVTTTAIPN